MLLLQQSEACKTTIQRLGSNISKLQINGNRNGNRIAGKGKYNSCYVRLNNILLFKMICYIYEFTLHLLTFNQIFASRLLAL